MPSEKILQQKAGAGGSAQRGLQEGQRGRAGELQRHHRGEGHQAEKAAGRPAASTRWLRTPCWPRAFAEAGIDGLEEQLNGTTAIAYSENGYTDAPKILSDYAKDNENFQVKAGFIDGSAVDAKSIDELAKLPPKEVLIAQVLGGLNGPIQGFGQRGQRRHPRPGYRPQRHCREAERLTASVPLTLLTKTNFGGIQSCLRKLPI